MRQEERFSLSEVLFSVFIGSLMGIALGAGAARQEGLSPWTIPFILLTMLGGRRLQLWDTNLSASLFGFSVVTTMMLTVSIVSVSQQINANAENCDIVNPMLG